MELGKFETDWGVPRTEDVQNGVSSDVYEGEIQAKKPKEEGKRNEEKGRGERRGNKEERKKKRMRDSLDQGGSGLSHFEGDFLKL